jgi:hypothetical protein
MKPLIFALALNYKALSFVGSRGRKVGAGLLS